MQKHKAKIHRLALTLICAALASFPLNTIYADKQTTQFQELKKGTRAFAEAENIKAIEKKLAKALIAEHYQGSVTAAVKVTSKKLWNATRNLDAKQRKLYLERILKTSKESLQKISKLSSEQIKGFAEDIVSNVKLDKNTLKNLVAGSGDAAGNSALRTLNQIDKALQSTGNVSAKLMKQLKSEASGLDPKRAKAFMRLIKKKFASDWKDITDIKTNGKGPGGLVGTVVDGVFVLNDAYTIYASDDDPEDKFIKASGKIIDYGAGTAAGVAAGAAQGAATTAVGGFLPGLVIALSANRVATLYSEIMLLEKDKAAAKSAEQSEHIQIDILARRQLLKISNLIKSGNHKQAEYLLNKMQRYLINHNSLSTEKLFATLNSLKAKLKKAKRIAKINQVINQARYPYKKSFNNYIKGRDLAYAKKLAIKARSILKKNSKKYPELKTIKANRMITELIAAIDAKIANAGPLKIVSVSGPKSVMAGESAKYIMKVTGGVPNYEPVEDEGYSDNDSVIVFWKAPAKPGKKKVKYTVQDNLKNTASLMAEVNVIEKIESSYSKLRGTGITFVFEGSSVKKAQKKLQAFNNFPNLNKKTNLKNGYRCSNTFKAEGNSFYAEDRCYYSEKLNSDLELTVNFIEDKGPNTLVDLNYKENQIDKTRSDGVNNYSVSIIAKKIPFKIVTNKNNYMRYDFKGDITPYLSKAKYTKWDFGKMEKYQPDWWIVLELFK